MGTPRVPLAERFWDKVNKSDGCWTWTAASNEKGYGVIGAGNGRNVLAHRASWSLAFGPIPDRLKVLHRCDVPSCVRPDHLFLGTAADNTADMIAKGRMRHSPRRGESNYRARLTDERVRYIRQERTRGRTLASLAAEIGVHLSTIHYASNGKNWRHV